MKMMKLRTVKEQVSRRGRLQFGDETSYFADFKISELNDHFQFSNFPIFQINPNRHRS